MAKIDALFDEMLAQRASDLHLAEGQPPKIRRHGRMTALPHPVLTEAVLHDYMAEICSAERWQHFVEKRDLDFAHTYGDRARYRVNYFCQAHGLGAVFRTIPTHIQSLDELGMPTVLKGLAQLRSGLVLVTGPTGSGKSTTLAAIIDLINQTDRRHIVTIEEPVEFVHVSKKSMICQREVGLDVSSFADGLRTAGRQDCDVVLVGEMRDYETIALALTAATRGPLVFGTLHTNSTVKTVDRIIEVFPAGQQPQVRSMLADSLKGVLSQILLRTADGTGRVAATEFLLANSALSNSIREGNTPNIRNIIQAGRSQGMQLLDDCIQQLLNDGRITPDEAYHRSLDKARFAHHVAKE